MTIAAVDRLVIQDDAAAARLWPHLGPKVRDAYLADRDSWVVLRRKADAGSPPSAETIASRHRAFAGWARAFHVAGRTPRHATTAHSSPRPRTPVAAASPATVRTTPVPRGEVPAALPAPTVAPAAVGKPLLAAGTTGGAAGAVAGGFVLAGLVALAARRKRS